MNNGHCKVKAKEEIKERLHRLEEDAKQATSFLGATEKPPGEESTDRIEKTERMEDQGKSTEVIKPEKREKRAWSEVVAPWAKRTEAREMWETQLAKTHMAHMDMIFSSGPRYAN